VRCANWLSRGGIQSPIESVKKAWGASWNCEVGGSFAFVPLPCLGGFFPRALCVALPMRWASRIVGRIAKSGFEARLHGSVPVEYDEGERTAGHFCRGEIAAARGVLDHITDTVVSHKVCFGQLYVFAFLIVLRFPHLFPWHFPSCLAQAFPHSWSRLLAMPLPSKRVETKEKSGGRGAPPPSNCHNFRIVTAIL
jgi:hypothetical protein